MTESRDKECKNCQFYIEEVHLCARTNSDRCPIGGKPAWVESIHRPFSTMDVSKNEQVFTD